MAGEGVSSIFEMCRLRDQPKEIGKRADDAIIECLKMWDVISEVPDDEVGFETVLKPLNDAERIYHDARFLTSFFEKVSMDFEQCKCSLRCCSEMENFWFDQYVYSDILKKVRILEEKKINLTGEYKYYLETLLKDGKKYGLYLPEDVLDKIKDLKDRIDDKCKDLVSIDESETVLEFTDEELHGLSESYINSLPVAVDTQKRAVNTKNHYLPIMRNCSNPETRKAMNVAFESGYMNKSTTILEEMISLRHKVALLLGYPNNASLVTSEMMLKTPENAKKFLMDLYEKCKPVWAAEKKQLLDMKEKECKELNIPFDGVLNQWDLDYYIERTKVVKCGLNEKKVREYFTLETVTTEMFKIYEKLFGIVITKVENPKRWRQEARLFRVEDSSDGELIGYFYLELYSPKTAIEGILTDVLRNAWIREDGSRQVPIAFMIACFPVPEANAKVLLPFSGEEKSVVGYFSKFGCMIHSICAKNELARFIAYDMPNEYHEIPSKVFENMCWEERQVRMLSAHYLTGSFIPDDMIASLLSSRTAIAGANCIREIINSLFDLEINSQDKVDIKAVLHRLHQELFDFAAPEGPSFYTVLSYACDDDATYFRNLWSAVVGCDIFKSAFKGHINEPEVGKRFRKIVLEPAGSKDMSDTIREFLGRDPTPDEFLRTMAFIA